MSNMLMLMGILSSGGDNLKALPEFTYTGQYELTDEGGGDFKLKLLTSGTFVPLRLNSAKKGIDVFADGAGGGSPSGARAGGGGGYTVTKKITLKVNVEYEIIIGAGVNGASGGNTSAFDIIAAGGNAASGSKGGNGGSGGGGVANRASPGISSSASSAGASDGNDAVSPDSGGNAPGKGQRSTPGPNGETGSTREFGEESGDLYSGGGAGVTVGTNAVYVSASGGEGGGGSYTTNGANGNSWGPGSNSTSGTANTGGGGAGGEGKTSGGSGILIIRNARS